jgi:hypothetical protein
VWPERLRKLKKEITSSDLLFLQSPQGDQQMIGDVLKGSGTSITRLGEGAV